MKDSKEMKSACVERKCILYYHRAEVCAVMLKRHPEKLDRQNLRYWEGFIYHRLGGVWARKKERQTAPCLFLTGEGRLIFGGLAVVHSREIVAARPLRESGEKGFEELMDFFEIDIDNY